MVGFMYLIVFQLAGEFVVHLFDLRISGAVMGMLILLLFFGVKKALFTSGMPESLKRTSHWLIPYLPLLLLPISVGVVQHIPVLKQYGIEFFLCLILATVFSLVVSGLTFKRLVAHFNK